MASQLITGNTVEGTQIKTFYVSTTGDWQAISIPSTIEDVRHIMINVHDDSEGYAKSKVQWLMSSESDGSVWDWVEGQITISVGKQAGETVLYAKADTSQVFAVTCLR